ncbi:MAG: ParB N-terminal domain-containing protein [Verrucomicrobiales bacterium]|nr:ParB N-terminal domain-containing protein [Verrucomicrobiales bacterium]
MSAPPQFLSPAAFRPHPSIASEIPDKGTEEWEDFVDEIEESGVKEPILFIEEDDGTWLIVDGLRRWEAVGDLSGTSIPAVRVSKEDGQRLLAARREPRTD